MHIYIKNGSLCEFLSFTFHFCPWNFLHLAVVSYSFWCLKSSSIVWNLLSCFWEPPPLTACFWWSLRRSQYESASTGLVSSSFWHLKASTAVWNLLSCMWEPLPSTCFGWTLRYHCLKVQEYVWSLRVLLLPNESGMQLWRWHFCIHVLDMLYFFTLPHVSINIQ